MENEKRRLIDVDMAKRATYEEVFWTESEQAVVRNFLARIPKVDAVEVVHGRWISIGANRYTRISQCSNCCAKYDFMSNYCPNCGAKMDGERKDNDRKAD